MAVMVFAGSGWMTSEETSETGEEKNNQLNQECEGYGRVN